MLIASTGSRDLDENVDRHVVIIEGEGEAEVPGARPAREIVYNNRRYSHVAEDAHGRWIYRLE